MSDVIFPSHIPPSTHALHVENHVPSSGADKCTLVVIALLTTLGIGLAVTGFTYSVKPLYIGGLSFAGAILTVGFAYIFFANGKTAPQQEGSTTSTQPEKEAAPSPSPQVLHLHDPSFKIGEFLDRKSHLEISGLDFWAKSLDQIRTIILVLDFQDINLSIPFKDLDTETQVVIYQTLKEHSGITDENRSTFWQHRWSKGVLAEMSEAEIVKYYGETVILSFSIGFKDTFFNDTKLSDYLWSEIRDHHQKILKAIFHSDLEKAKNFFFIQNLFEQHQHISFTKEEMLEELVLANLDFLTFFEKVKPVKDGKLSEIAFLFLKRALSSENPWRGEAFKTLFSFADCITVCLTKEFSLYEGVKKHLKEILDLLPDERIAELGSECFEPEIETLLCDYSKANRERGLKYFEHKFTLDILKQLSEEEVTSFYGQRVIDFIFKGDGSLPILKFGEKSYYWDLSTHKLVLSVKKHYPFDDQTVTGTGFDMKCNEILFSDKLNVEVSNKNEMAHQLTAIN